MAQEASWRAGGRTKPGKNKSHHNTPRRHQQHIKKIKNAVKHLKDRPVEGGFLMVGNSLGFQDNILGNSFSLA
jgi:predicted alpha/beta-fold hydrolase